MISGGAATMLMRALGYTVRTPGVAVRAGYGSPADVRRLWFDAG